MSKKLQFSDFKVQLSRPVEWCDIDAARHVNNLAYLRWVEMGRLRYFAAMGMDMSLEGQGVGMILGWQDCRYTFPMTFDDTALIGIRTHELADDYFMLQTAVFSKEHERLAAVSLQRIVPYDYGRLARVGLPAGWRTGIAEAEQSESAEPD